MNAISLSRHQMEDELRRVHGDPLQLVLSLARQYGDVVPYETSYGSAYLLNHPDHVARVFTHPNYRRAPNYPFKSVLGEGLLSSEGETWKRHRRLMQPEFHRERIAALGPLIAATATDTRQKWAQFADQTPFDVAPEMFQLMLDIAIEALFSGDIKNEAVALRQAITTLIGELGGLVNTQFAIPLFFTSERNRQFKAALQEADRIVSSMVRGRRGRVQAPHDLLSLLMNARYENTDAGLDERQLRDELLTMLFAGSESSALMLSWTWHLLAEHPHVEQRLHDELARVLNGRAPTIEDLPQLPYGRMVLEETLRMRPPVWSIFRQAVAEDEIAGQRIEAKAAIIVSAYAMHHDSRFWDAPHEFRPERFALESASRPRYAYFPFGGGQHLCIGNGLALIEGQMVLSILAQRFRLRAVPNHPVVPLPGVTLRPKHGVLMTLETRLQPRLEPRTAACA